ncbi:MAG: PQQ-binding-like beta-propeller repeat protein [Proteobacteria bacterium]|nr:PQQ-binding-like beta-propeller repeat protein [Pseudomonadota bacterium]
MTHRFTRIAAALGIAGLLGACSAFGDAYDGVFSGSAEEKLPGQRIAILSLDRGLRPDPAVAELQVRLSEPYVNRTWTHYGGNPEHAMYHLALGDSPRRVWSADIGEGSGDDRRLLAQPLVVDGVVYTMDSLATVSAYDAARGGLKWRSDLEPEDEDDGYFGGGIAYDAGRIYVSTGFARVFSLDAETGAVIWRQPVPAPIRAAPTAANGRVFVVTLDNQTIALSAENGERLWNHSGLQEATSLVGGASPAVSGSTVIVPYSSGEIVGLLAENGRVLWSESLSSMTRIDPLGDIAHIRGAPVIDRGVVFAISHSGRMIAVDLRRGVRAWEAALGGVEMPWVGGEFIFVLTNDAQLVCLTRREGRIRWVRPLARFANPEKQEGPIHWSGPVLAGDRLIVAGSNRQALSISPYSGEVLGVIELPDSVFMAPVVADNSLYFLTEGGKLVVLR